MADAVTEQRELSSKGGMGVFGWAMFLGMLVLLLPLLPFYLLLKLYERLRGGPGGERHTPGTAR